MNSVNVYRDYKLDINLENKVTVIIGRSGTGKSTMHKVLERIDGRRKIGKVLISDKQLSLLFLRNKTDFLDRISGESLLENRIYIIDEGSIKITNYEASIIQHTKNSYFIITARDSVHALNYDLNAVKELIKLPDGRITFKQYIDTHIKYGSELRTVNIDTVLIEDSGKAKYWFDKLFENMELKTESTYGKDSICSRTQEKLLTDSGNILVIFDKCSFGCYASRFKGVINGCESRVYLLADYKSWEYLMLQTNMFKDRFIPYTIKEQNFEEVYYEIQLENLSGDNGESSRFTSVRHESKTGKQNKLSLCYFKPCCGYQNTRVGKCKYGLSGDDKMVALLEGTVFEGLLFLTRRV